MIDDYSGEDDDDERDSAEHDEREEESRWTLSSLLSSLGPSRPSAGRA